MSTGDAPSSTPAFSSGSSPGRLHDEFGRDDYEAVKEEVGQAIAQQAQMMGLNPVNLLQELSRRDQLYTVLASATRNVLYPRIREAAAKAKADAEAAKVTTAKGAKLTGKGTPAGAVKASKKVDNWNDAVNAALEEDPRFKDLQ